MIKVMPEILANKIKAGEVVEKCVSVVKELVENSIDAKADVIEISLIQSGTEQIKVIDNGIGMNEADAKMCFFRHATSKLVDYDDLYSIDTLGFRGEALPSIASVSKVNLKTSDTKEGTEVIIVGGEIIEVKPNNLRKGTIITVDNLFFNTPARLKYLSSLFAQLSNIVSYINKVCLSHPHIKFTLSNDGKQLINSVGDGNLLKAIHSVYGLEVAKKMFRVNNSNNDYEIDGYISYPEVNRANKDYITMLVNGRYVKNFEIIKCINESYHTYKPENRYPIVVLNIVVDTTLVDVNVHPTKMDVKFSKSEVLKNLIETTIKSELSVKTLIPEVKVCKPNYGSEIVEQRIDFSVNENTQNYSYKQKLENSWDDEEKFDLTMNNLLEKTEEINEKQDIEQRTEKRNLELNVVGLVHGTYIVCQNNEGMYLIDQHAAAERVNYEIVVEKLGEETKTTVELLVPIIIEYPLNECIIIKNKIDQIKKVGIDITEFGPNSFAVKNVPIWLPKNNEQKAIKSIIDIIVSKKEEFDKKKFNENIAIMMSCKMSIKANQNISIEEMNVLIKKLENTKNPWTCPHGRPTIIKWTNYELEKLFKRSL